MVRRISRIVGAVIAWLKRVVTQPREELSRWQRAARFVYDLSRYGGRQLRHDRAPQMAGALTFRTLFALVPVLIVGTILVKGLRGTEAFLDLTHQLFISLGLDELRVVPPAEAVDAGASMSLADWLQGLVGQATQFNLSAVGWLGAALIGYAAISLIVTIENTFNTVYHAPEGRPWTRRVPLYWFVLTVSPVIIGVSWYVNNQVAGWIESVPTWHVVLVAAKLLWAPLMGWLILFVVYTQLPNTTVKLRSAAIGALVAALLVELGKRLLDSYLENAFAVSQLYGSLGLVPLFLFWVYLMWLAVLFGLQVSATLQALRGRDLEEMEPAPVAVGVIDPAAVVSATEIVAQRFVEGKPTDTRDVAESCGLPESVVKLMFTRLVDERVLHWVDANESAVALARPVDKVTSDELLQIGFQLADEAGTGRQSILVEQLRQAQRELAAQTTLAALVAPGK